MSSLQEKIQRFKDDNSQRESEGERSRREEEEKKQLFLKLKEQARQTLEQIVQPLFEEINKEVLQGDGIIEFGTIPHVNSAHISWGRDLWIVDGSRAYAFEDAVDDCFDKEHEMTEMNWKLRGEMKLFALILAWPESEYKKEKRPRRFKMVAAIMCPDQEAIMIMGKFGRANSKECTWGEESTTILLPRKYQDREKLEEAIALAFANPSDCDFSAISPRHVGG